MGMRLVNVFELPVSYRPVVHELAAHEFGAVPARKQLFDLIRLSRFRNLPQNHDAALVSDRTDPLLRLVHLHQSRLCGMGLAVTRLGSD